MAGIAADPARSYARFALVARPLNPSFARCIAGADPGAGPGARAGPAAGPGSRPEGVGREGEGEGEGEGGGGGGRDAGERAAEASGDDQARRRRDGSGDGDRDDAQANDDHTGIEQARGAQAVPRERLGPRTMGNDNPKLKQRGHDAIRDGEERYWKRISTP